MDEHKTLIRATFDGRIAALSDRCYTNSLLTAHGFTAIAATHHQQRLSSKKDNTVKPIHRAPNPPFYSFQSMHLESL